MRSRKPALPATGPAIDDVSRLWTYITTEWVTDLQLRLYPRHASNGSSIVMAAVESPRYVGDNRQEVMFVWASKEFSQTGYMISWGQLYDLLIVAFRQIELELAPPERSH